MSCQTCPNCHTKSGLRKYLSILMSFENWALALLYGLVVLAFAEKLKFTAGSTSAFIFMAVIPLIFKVNKKFFCQNCGIDFSLDSVSAQDGEKTNTIVS